MQRKVGKKLFSIVLPLLLFGMLLFFGGHWVLAIIFFVVAIIIAIISYKISGGAENPEIYEEKDIFDLIKYAVKSSNARVGFHSLRSQKEILTRLQNGGILVSESSDVRKQIRKLIVTDRTTFELCRDLIVIQTLYKVHEYFWDGYGNPKTVNWFNQAEIIIDIQSGSLALVQRLFELMKQK